MHDDSDFSSDSTKERGHFVSISESIKYYNLLIISTIIKSKRDLLDDVAVLTTLSTAADDDSLNSLTHVPILDISYLMGRTFLLPASENRQHLQVRIVKAIED